VHWDYTDKESAHVVKDLLYFSYKRLHVGEALAPDHKIVSIIRKLGVEKD